MDELKTVLVRNPRGERRKILLEALNESWLGGDGEGVPDAWGTIMFLKNKLPKVRAALDSGTDAEEVVEAVLEIAPDPAQAEAMGFLVEHLWHLCLDLKAHALAQAKAAAPLLELATFLDEHETDTWTHCPEEVLPLRAALASLRTAQLGGGE